VTPVFERVCARCHQPGGSAGLDLTSLTAWTTHAAAIRHVLDTGAMPPPGTSLPAPDLAALREFLKTVP